MSGRRWRRAVAFAAAAVAVHGRPASAQHAPAPPLRFVVLGHVRGDANHRTNPKLGELLAQVRTLKPDFVVLGGDAIWGDVDHNPSRPAEVEAEWDALDSALATLRVPVYRVPGNHDIPDVGARDIWIRRYGRPPSVVTVRGTRLILLATAFIPPDGDTTHHKYISGVDLDSGQVSFLRRTLADTGFAHTFVFTGHLRWWEPDSGRWWREVHPLLAAAHVDNVFTGDYGPYKFSTLLKDGVRYYQTSMESGLPSLTMLQRRIGSRLLSSQFDNFLEVRAGADSVQVVVHTLAEVSGGMFTPQMWTAIEDVPPPSLASAAKPLVDTWKKKLALALLVLGLFGAGVVAGRLTRGRAA